MKKFNAIVFSLLFCLGATSSFAMEPESPFTPGRKRGIEEVVGRADTPESAEKRQKNEQGDVTPQQSPFRHSGLTDKVSELRVRRSRERQKYFTPDPNKDQPMPTSLSGRTSRQEQGSQYEALKRRFSPLAKEGVFRDLDDSVGIGLMINGAENGKLISILGDSQHRLESRKLIAKKINNIDELIKRIIKSKNNPNIPYNLRDSAMVRDKEKLDKLSIKKQEEQQKLNSLASVTTGFFHAHQKRLNYTLCAEDLKNIDTESLYIFSDFSRLWLGGADDLRVRNEDEGEPFFSCSVYYRIDIDPKYCNKTICSISKEEAEGEFSPKDTVFEVIDFENGKFVLKPKSNEISFIVRRSVRSPKEKSYSEDFVIANFEEYVKVKRMPFKSADFMFENVEAIENNNSGVAWLRLRNAHLPIPINDYKKPSDLANYKKLLRGTLLENYPGLNEDVKESFLSHVTGIKKDSVARKLF